MKAFASDRNHPVYERHILHLLETELGVIDVTGLSAWERAQKVYGGLAEGVATDRQTDARPRGAQSPTALARGAAATPSASPVKQDPLFPNEDAA